MKKIIIPIIFSLISGSLFSQQYINFHIGTNSDTYQLYEMDSLYFDVNHTVMFFVNNGTIIQKNVSDIDSITFTTDASQNVFIDFQGTNAVITNPLSSAGVSITNNGANVIINAAAGIKDINYICSGTTSNGSVKVYSDKRFNLLLNNVNITNSAGPAINIQSDKNATIHLVSGTNNYLTDGSVYSTSASGNNTDEDQKAALFSESDLFFTGGGNLTVTGTGADKHAICSDDEITVYEGGITVVSASKDGIHASDGFYMFGGAIEVTSTGDGIDADESFIEIHCGDIIINSNSDDVKGIVCDSIMTITGGNITLTINGDKSKGLKSKQDILLHGGTISGTANGGVILEPSGSGYDPSYCTLIKGDQDVVIDGAVINFTTTGTASRGISCDGNLTVQNGTITIVSSGNGNTYTNSTGVTDAYHGSCMSIDGNLNIYNGTISLSNSGSGGKGISCDTDITFGNGTSQPQMNVVTTGQKITISSGGPWGGDYDESKAIKSDQTVTINSGNLTISSADDGIKAEVAININGGTIHINNSVEGMESPNITVNDGDISIISSDDGFNATYGNGGEFNDGSQLDINGGYMYISSSNGDAIDSNGDFTVTGGTMVVHGPQSSPEVGIDVNGTSLISGGFVIVSGPSTQMLEGFSSSSQQYSLILKTNQSISANTIIHLEDAGGNEIFTFKPSRTYRTLVFSSSLLANGTTYNLYTGGSSTGTELNGLYTGGAYNPGTLKKTFSISSKVTNVTF